MAAASPAIASETASKFRPAPASGIAGEYVVVLQEGAARGPGREAARGPSVREVAQRLTARYGGTPTAYYEHALSGFEARISEPAARRMAVDPRVRFVEQNHAVEIDTIANCNPRHATVAVEPGSPVFQSNPVSPQPISCVDPDPIRRASDPPAGAGEDPTYYLSCTDNWGLDLLDGARDGQYTFTAKGRGIHVYTIDAGINAEHQEFEDLSTPVDDSRVKRGFNAAAAANGVSDPAVLNDTRDCSGNSHGSHVAAIIGGNTFGVAKEVLLHPVKFGDRCSGRSYATTAATARKAMEWIAEHHNLDADLKGPGVVNYSGGNAGDSAFRDEATALAVRSLIDAGLVFVQSAGNQNDMLKDGVRQDACVSSLGSYAELEDGLIVVGGVDETVVSGQRVLGRWLREIDPRDPSYDLCRLNPPNQSPSDLLDCGSNSGTCVDLWAPGGHIVSATQGGTDTACRLSGTSMAAPHVTGVVALYLDAQCPDATTASCVVLPADAKSALVQGATCGALEDDPLSPYSIGAGSPNRLVNSLLNGSCAQENHPPVAGANSFTTPFNTSFTFLASTLLANDSDPDGDEISFYGLSRLPSHGDLSIDGVGPEDIVYRYTPHGGFIGSDSFDYLVQDSRGASATGTATITVTAQGFAGNQDFFATPADTRLRVLSTDLTSNDSPGAVFIRAENARHGTLSIAGVGPEAIVYDFFPDSGFLGEAGFDYLISPDGSEPYTRVVVTILVSDGPPSPAFTASCSGLSCSFDGSPTTDDVAVAGYAWSFGDGATAVGVTAAHAYGTSASFLATLTVTDSRGQTASTSQVMTVDALPVPSFTFTCNGLSCAFDASGTTDNAGIASYAWAFGDGATGSGVTASRTYATSGERTATLTVTDTFGQTASTSRTVRIDLPPTSSFVFACTGLTCSFDASASSDEFGIAAYAWSFGDGATGSGRTASRTYAASGTRTVTLTVTDTAGQTATTTRQVTADAPPVASFAPSCSGRTCTFSGSGSTDNASILSYAWSFGDGTTASGVIVTHTFATSGTFTVTLCVTDTAGQTACTTRTVVVDLAPTACFTASCSGLTCSVNAGCSTDDLGITSYAWSFGDGATGTGVTASRTYATSGARTVTLTVADARGQTNSTTRTVNPDALPVANFTWSCAQRTCSFNGTSSTDNQPIAAYAWTFGDGATGTGATPSRIYAVGGSYSVKLTVTDSAGQTAQKTQAITVNRPPVAVGDAGATNRDTPIDLNVLANDSDPDGHALSVTAWSQGAHGGVTKNANGTLRYSPQAGYTGPDSFTYTISDGNGDTATATVGMTVTVPNNPPDARDDGWRTYQNGPTNIPYSHLLANDYDPNGDPLVVTNVNVAGLTGTLDCSSGTYCRYTPPSWFVGATSFTYSANDGKGGTDPATVRIKVGIANTPPAPQDDILETTRNTALVISRATLLANDADADGDLLSVPQVTRLSLVGFGTLSCSAAYYTCTYTPPAGFTGVDIVSYRASDGIDFTDARIRVLVRPGSTPALDAREDQIFSTTSVTYISYTRLLANDYDPEGGPLTVVNVDTTGLNGTLDCTTSTTGCDYRGTAEPTRFRYTVRDPQGNLDTTTVTIKAGNWSWNKPPVLADDTMAATRNTPKAFSVFDLFRNDYDPDNDQLNILGLWYTPNGRIACSAPTYSCTYTPNTNFTGVDTFTYNADDGNNSVSATVTINVTP